MGSKMATVGKRCQGGSHGVNSKMQLLAMEA
ncbi:hypothetical protein T07_13130 [Trichinella nelsoni]|uniref:Uncharacterized protein n=1 Tax=Trichinella nelsoni TaxID=6336 RepID=A0A0V0RAZ6_9BILA|nr:hypothetical protein T07_13130 [Trichinella nelsoni]